MNGTATHTQSGTPGASRFPRPAEVLSGLRTFWTHGRRAERICYAVGALLIASGVVHLAVYAVDGGPWTGPVSWRKPITFGLSFGLTVISLTWVTSFVRLGDRARAALLGVFGAASVLEVALITVQRWRGVPSHLNMEDGLDSAISRVLAAGGGVIVLTVALLTIAAFRTPARSDTASAAGTGVGASERPAGAGTASMRLALRVGFGALMLSMLAGAAMIARGVVLVQQGHQQAAYHAIGALKPAHAVLMHAVLVLPALAWLLSLTGLPEARRFRVVAGVSLGYALSATAVTVVSLIDFIP
ncbi:hypothetical protein [Actinomadura rupiterrae]|uniref:hypothetical protein n=1 Tax=Actinomadura rupiterrae TaxID=559627 RepID=UPI0020A50EF3|nr:hypothetical protein [Actinomadura rupiterrae]MCP2335861.1 hypothetical protein [Actinomadura rupiterrae]